MAKHLSLSNNKNGLFLEKIQIQGIIDLKNVIVHYHY